MAVGRGSEEAGLLGGESITDGIPASVPAEPAKVEGDSGLGVTLVTARERRGISRADVATETRIPSHYLQMLESDDYSLISDQLYLLPFLRRYAAFLGLDGEEIGMRFVREVQRAEGAMSARMSEPLELPNGRAEARWTRVAAAAGIVTVMVVLYLIVAERHREVPPPPAALSAAPAAPSAALAPSDVAPSAASAQPAAAFVPGGSIAGAPSSTNASKQQAAPSAPATSAGRAAKPVRRDSR